MPTSLAVRRTALNLALSLALICALLPGTLAAQEPEPTPTPAPDEAPVEGSNTGIEEEITVTARKMGEETAQEVPMSVAAPSEEQLRNRGAEDLEDVATNVAGFTVQNLGPGQSQVTMRGVSSGQIVRDQPGVKEQVGVYLDETPISLSLFTPDIDLFDLDRVEVLRGPQGTLFGSGSLSGTVRYITNQAELGSTASVAELTASNISDGGFGGSAKVAVNQPLGSTAAMRVTAYFTSYGGYMDAVQPNFSVKEDVNDGERMGARVSFRFEPSESFTLTPRLIYQEIDMNGWNRIDAFNILANPYTTSRPPVRLGEREQFTQLEEKFTDDFLLADLNAEYRLGNGMAITSVTSYTDRDVLVVRDAGALTSSITGGSIGLPQNVYTLDSPLDDATAVSTLSQELRLSSAEGALRWIAGVFYSTQDRDYGQSLDVAGFQSLTGIPTAGSFGAGRDILFYSDLSYDLDQTALFGEASYDIGERFEVTGGLRYYDFDEERTQTFDGIFADPGTTSGSTSADGFAPRVIASFLASDSTRINAQVSKGFRLGGINDPLNVPLCTPQDLVIFGGRDRWEDETAWNYEVGSKSNIMGGRGSFNVSAFYMDIEDLQATVTAGSCSSRLIFNVPKARSQGVELELAAAPSSNFDFSLSASYNDSELRSTVATGSGDVVAGLREGNRLPTVPELQAAASATYQWPVRTTWLAYVTGTFQHVGSRYTQFADQEAGFGVVNLNSFGANTIGGPLTQSTFTFDPEMPSYETLNLRVGLLMTNVEVALFVNNATDELALLSLDQERGLRARVGYQTNEPRTFGITTRLNFR
jgi:iron complex outermembrane receptor protein